MVKNKLKRIVFSKHAKAQMNWRGVTESEVEFALMDPDIKKPLLDEKDKYLNIKITDSREVRVWYYDFKDRIFIKSACVNKIVKGDNK